MKLVKQDTIRADYDITLKDLYNNLKKEYPNIQIFYLEFENNTSNEQIIINTYKEIPTIEKETNKLYVNKEGDKDE